MMSVKCVALVCSLIMILVCSLAAAQEGSAPPPPNQPAVAPPQNPPAAPPPKAPAPPPKTEAAKETKPAAAADGQAVAPTVEAFQAKVKSLQVMGIITSGSAFTVLLKMPDGSKLILNANDCLKDDPSICVKSVAKDAVVFQQKKLPRELNPKDFIYEVKVGGK